ncbi:MAG: ROK family transcriptional regulator [Jatrophihabitans sp.]
MPASPGAARPDAIRRHNLGLVLRHIHLDGALTRAELTARLGVSRSTVGALVADLTQLRLVQEVVPAGGAGVGRPSHVVAPHAGGPYTIAVDFDVPRMIVAAVGVGGTVLMRERAESLPGLDHVMAAAAIAASIKRVSEALDDSAWLVGVGVSVPGTVDRHSGRIGVAPNLGWRDAPLGAALTHLLPDGIPVLVANDADLAVLAEYLRGSARGCEDVVYVLGRTGVGAGIIAGGVALRGHDGHAGEIGHDVVDESGPPCHCGKRGCVETYVGDGALLAGAGLAGPPTEQSVARVFAAARAGDATALAAVEQVAHALGRAVASLVNALNPQRMLLGGSLSELLDLARPTIERSLARYALAAAGDTVQLVQPTLGTDSMLLGAAEMAFTRLLEDPLTAQLVD